MDIVLEVLDPIFFDQLYSPISTLHDRTYWVRQFISIYLIWWIGGTIMYFVTAALSYWLVFDKSLRNHKLFLPNQEWLEITVAFKSIPLMAIPSALIFLGEVRGYSKLYDGYENSSLGWTFLALSVLLYLVFTDTCIYWIHRWLHHPLLYAPIHKLHHKWVISTPFASHAFHPADGFAQSFPYHLYVYLFPLNKYLYLALFLFVNIWTVSIHDNCSMYFGSIINGADHHTIHHTKFNYNYGQYFTLWDRMCGTWLLPPSAAQKNKAKSSE